MAWATVEQLAEYLGRAADDRMAVDLAASLAWCARKRRDLEPAASPPELVDLGEPGDQYVVTVSYEGTATATPVTPDTPPEDVTISWGINRAVLIYAALLYQQRANPAGFATYTDLGDNPDVADAMANVYRLLGARKPKAC